MSKKLYAVTVEYTAYVWAENQDEAEQRDFVREIVSNEEPNIFAIETDNSNILGWYDNCCIYHNGDGDVVLADVKTW
jgi:hypothetical protein